jgi:hypothetical protein
MNELSAFKLELERLIGKKASHLRPFVCEGSPLDCGVFIVGFNPATKMAGDFWDHWRPGYGFDKAAWLAAYKEQRSLRALKSGKQYRPVGNARRVIEWVLEEVNPLRCLETNIYAVATAKATELSKRQQDMEPFSFLLERIKPRVVVTHGKAAAEAAKQLGIGKRENLICETHFSRGWSELKARELGQQIRAKWDSHA